MANDAVTRYEEITEAIRELNTEMRTALRIKDKAWYTELNEAAKDLTAERAALEVA
jgi:hypothetical protein